MANKTQVTRLLARQGAQWEEGEDCGDYLFSAWLPENLIWNTGYGCGSFMQTKERGESMAEFWDAVMCVIGGDVVAKDRD